MSTEKTDGGYVRYKVTIGGDSVLMHNAQTADPQNRFSKAMKAITSIRKKTDADYAQLARLEYEAGLYLNAEKQVVIPSRVLEATIFAGAKVTKEGKQALAGLFVDTDVLLAYDGGPLSVKELLDSETHKLVVPVVIQKSKNMRTRPLFQNWSGSFIVSILSSLVNERQLKLWIQNAGAQKGIGDWRPRYGRFNVREFKVA